MRKHLIIALLFISSCSTKLHSHSSSAGVYKYVIIKTATDQPPVVTGNIFGYHSNPPSPAAGAIRIAEKVVSKTDSNGHFFFSVSP